MYVTWLAVDGQSIYLDPVQERSAYMEARILPRGRTKHLLFEKQPRIRSSSGSNQRRRIWGNVAGIICQIESPKILSTEPRPVSSLPGTEELLGS